MTTKNAQRLSQLISTFGPGAMIDLPTRSVVVGGLEQWDMRGNAFTMIPEPRLTMRLEQLLKDQGRLNPAARLSLRTPPVSGDGRDGIPRGSPLRCFRRGLFASWWRRRRPAAKARAGAGWCAGRIWILRGGAGSNSTTGAKARSRRSASSARATRDTSRISNGGGSSTAQCNARSQCGLRKRGQARTRRTPASSAGVVAGSRCRIRFNPDGWVNVVGTGRGYWTVILTGATTI
jgi:hypothetical protein